MKILINNRTFLGVFFSVLVTVFAVAVFTYATTIGSDVSVTGALTVTGATTLNGKATLGNAVGDVITATGYFTQMRIGTDSTFDDIGTVGADELGVEGAMEVDGISYLDGGAITAASSTHSTGVFNVGSGSLGVASSTPQQELGVVGDAYISATLGVATSTAAQELAVTGDVFQSSSATTTHFLSSSGTNVGGCIEMLRSNGTKVRIYIGASTTAQATDTNFLVVEAGTCQ